jgi:ribosomal protein S18 acetylase RimI-like enzyme
VVHIEVTTELTEELVEAFARLVPQLSERAPAPTSDELSAIVQSPSTRVLVARDEERIVGTLTLALFRIPTGMRAWIEDVVVDESARGQGAGEALTREAIRLAAGAGARTVELTSRPDRTAANRLYAKLGFRQRETNVYRYEIGDSNGTL